MKMREKCREFLKAAFKNKSFVIGVCMVLSLIIIALLENQLAAAPFDKGDLSLRLHAPGNGHLLGTDNYGRDVLSRIIYGVRLALMAAILGTTVELLIGVVVGLTAGFFGGKIDQLLTFITDLFWSLPTVVVAMAIVMLMGKSLVNVIIALALAGWPKYARIVRSKTMSVKNMVFVETGVAFGERKSALMFYYILPNIVPSIIVMASVSMPGIITSTATLSFLGLGAQPPSPDWGLAISTSASLISIAPWMAVFPGIALVYTVFAFTFLGEGLRDLFDPNLKMD